MKGRSDWLGMLVLTLTLALLLSIVPLPPPLAVLRPYWVGLVLLYWALEEQDVVSLGLAFVTGLVLDVLTASLLGLHALSLLILVFLVQRFRARLRFFPPWQQAASVFALLLNDRIILLWVAMLLGEPRPTWHYWLPPLVGTVVWPWLFLLLDRARFRSRQIKT